jgi:hypothetical protein
MSSPDPLFIGADFNLGHLIPEKDVEEGKKVDVY